MRKFFYNLVVGQGFLTMTQNPDVIKEKTYNFNYILEKYLQSKSIISKDRKINNRVRGCDVTVHILKSQSS